MKKLVIYTALLLGLISCDMELELVTTQDNVFVIPKGKHTSTHSFQGFDGNKISFDAQFNESAKYQNVNPENQADINKLMGFSSCNTHHHQNSARIGWRWYNEELEIFAYIYDNGDRITKYITSVPFNESLHYEIQRVPQGYVFNVNGETATVETSSSCSGTANYMLWPYFGGDETAPHDIVISVDILDNPTQEEGDHLIGG